MRQLLKHFHWTAGTSARSSDSKNKWRKVFRQAARLDCFTDPFQSVTHIFVVLVHISWPYVHEWGLVFFFEKILPNSSDKVKRPCDSGESSESDKSFIVSSNAFKIDHSNIKVEHLVKQWHVIGLGFDSVGEKEVSFVGDQFINGHLLDPKDNLSLINIFLDNRSCSLEIVFTIAPVAARLDQNLNAQSSELRNLVGGDRASTLPFIFVLS